MTELYPWLSPLWNEWKKSLEAGRFPNSSIVNAPLGLGVEKAVDQLTASLMCI
ncbi:DNA polymerase III subunit delta', partial [Vibrio fortis]